MATYEGTEIFVELLNANGVQFVFYNPGFDVVPLLSTMARYKVEGKAAPIPIMCLDEFTALNAAHGNYIVSNRPQVVLVHSELGTQQVGGAIQQAYWGRVPVLICAANMVSPTRVNWKKEPYDQGMMLRNCVKWDHEVGRNETFYEALRQAFQMATSDPTGPVYFSYPMEALTKKTELPAITAAEKIPLSIADAGVLKKAADLLLNAVNPVIMAGYLGRHHQAVNSLVELAETLGARVVTSPIRMNFPSNHPLCANMEPGEGMKQQPYFLSADVVLAIDYDIPYAHPRTQPNPQTRVIHIDTDFVKQGDPLWPKNISLAISADSSQAVPALTQIVRRKITPEQSKRAQDRFLKIQAENLKIREGYRTRGKEAAGKKPISSEWLTYCINEVIGDDTIVVNQVISPGDSVTRQIPRNQPGSLVACAGGTIGWALGAGLGAKMAAPDKMVVTLLGDGAFVYGGPTATLWPANYYQAPFLTVIFNNRAYGAIKMLFQGDWKEGIQHSEIAPSPDYSLTARACGAYGRVVEDSADVLPALKEAIQQVRQGKAAVLDVRVE